MRIFTRIVFPVAILTITAGLVPFITWATIDAPKKVENGNYFPLAEGNSWTYKVTVAGKESTIVAKVTGKTKVADKECWVIDHFANWGEEQVSIAQTSEGVVIYGEGNHYYNMPWPLIKYPIKKGDQWKVRPEKDASVEVVVVNDGEEEIKVPAGALKCAKITTTLTMKAGGREEKATVIQWLANDIGLVKQIGSIAESSEKVSMELLSYQIKPAGGK